MINIHRTVSRIGGVVVIARVKTGPHGGRTINDIKSLGILVNSHD